VQEKQDLSGTRGTRHMIRSVYVGCIDVLTVTSHLLNRCFSSSGLPVFRSFETPLLWLAQESPWRDDEEKYGQESRTRPNMKQEKYGQESRTRPNMKQEKYGQESSTGPNKKQEKYMGKKESSTRPNKKQEKNGVDRSKFKPSLLSAARAAAS